MRISNLDMCVLHGYFSLEEEEMTNKKKIIIIINNNKQITCELYKQQT
jgi:hypothetical protein